MSFSRPKDWTSSGGRHSWPVWSAVLLLTLVQYGCGIFPDRQPAAEFTPLPPLRSDRFTLPSEGTDVVGNVQVTMARHEDTLPDIARRYDLGYDEIVSANPGVDPWLPGKGTRVVLPTQFILPKASREGLVLNLASLRLFHFPTQESGKPLVVNTHPIGIGREGWQTPQGKTRITQKRVKPHWTVPASVRKEHALKGDPLPPVVPPGPDNPLGEFAMRLSLPSYLIHGTNKPWGVGMRISHGCVRLYPEDIARLFPDVPVGTKVNIVNQPYVAGWLNGVIYLEAHQPLAEDRKRWGDSLQPMEEIVGEIAGNFPDSVDWEKAKRVAREARGIPIPISPSTPELTELLTQARPVPSMPPWTRLE